MTAEVPELSDLNSALCGALVLAVPLAGAGLALLNAGMSRSRSAAHAMLASVCAVAVAVLVYFACGWSWQSFPGHAAHSLLMGGKLWSWLGAEPFFMRGLALDGSRASLAAWLQMFSVGLAALIPLGTGGERWRLGAICGSTALLAGFTYPLFAHWVWGGGWLAQLGPNMGWGAGLVDPGGSGAIQAVGGLTALAMARILGARRGKYDTGGPPSAFPGHNAVLVTFGCFLAWLGWIGLNGAGNILWSAGGGAALARVAVNTTVCAAAGLLATAALTRVRFGLPDASLCANGWTGGLVASGAVCAVVGPVRAAVIGLLAGVLVTFSVEWLDALWHVDDPTGSISVHAGCGIWGLLAVAIFAGASGANQGLAQLAGVAALLVVILPVTYSLNWLLNRFSPQRVSPDGETHGLDLYELGAGAYPEFVTRRDDFRLK